MTTVDTYLEQLSENATNTEAAVIAGMAMVGPQPLGDDRFQTQLIPAGASVKVFDLEELEDANADHPRRKKGTVHVQDAVSFVGYVHKHGLPETEVWADLARRALVGVLNAHAGVISNSEDSAGHGDHRVELELMYSGPWKAWLSLDKKWVDQQAFAEHLEDNASEIIVPDAATMLEIAESFHASVGTNFKSAQRLHDGLINFRHEETATTRAGHNEEFEVPKEFTLALAPFEGGKVHEVTARFRYRLRSGALSLSYALLNPDDIVRQAFLDEIAVVETNITAPVYHGRPA